MTGDKLADTTVAGELAVSRRLTASEFQGLSEVPPELEWFANITNPNTHRAYRVDVGQFVEFAGIHEPEDFRRVTRAHVIAWRKSLEDDELAPATIRRKLSALGSLFDYLCEANAVAQNPTHGVRRPSEGSNEGKTPAIGDAQALALLEAPAADTIKGLRDRAILAVLLYHGLRRDELVKLRVRDLQERSGVLHFSVAGKGGKRRYVPAHLAAVQRVREYLKVAGHRDDADGALFRRVRGGKPDTSAEAARGLDASSVYDQVVKRYAATAGIDVPGFSPHSLRATAATNAIEGGADLEQTRDWLGHANVATTTLYDRRRKRPEDSPTFKVNYRRRRS